MAEGNYEADEETLEAARRRRGGCSIATARPKGRWTRPPTSTAPRNSIAGVVNERGNVLGHDAASGKTTSKTSMGLAPTAAGLFAGLVAHLEKGGIAFFERSGDRFSREENASNIKFAFTTRLLARRCWFVHCDLCQRAKPIRPVPITMIGPVRLPVVRPTSFARHGGRADERHTRPKPVVIENVGGAGGSIALARCPPAQKADGYTIAIGNAGTNAATYTIYPKADVHA